MKYILIISCFIFACKSEKDRPINLEVVYFNGQKDTIKTIAVEAWLYNGNLSNRYASYVGGDVLACGVRSFKEIK